MNRQIATCQRDDHQIYKNLNANPFRIPSDSSGQFPTCAIVFAIFGILGFRLPVALILGYLLHGFWDIVHEIARSWRSQPIRNSENNRDPLGVRRFLCGLRLVHRRLFLHSSAGVECGLEGAWPIMMTMLGNRVMARLAVIPILLLPQLASAKRIAPARADPVVYEGIRYVAPNDDGRRGYIEAWSVATNKKLWELTLFTNHIDPKLEEDVQWVFIKALNIEDGRLMVTSESGKTYQIDVNTKGIRQSDSSSSPSPAAIRDVSNAVKKALTNGLVGKKYDLSFRMNPSYLEGDFSGDRKMDTAVLVKNARPGRLGLRSIIVPLER